jgi:hypothetical protein
LQLGHFSLIALAFPYEIPTLLEIFCGPYYLSNKNKAKPGKFPQLRFSSSPPPPPPTMASTAAAATTALRPSLHLASPHPPSRNSFTVSTRALPSRSFPSLPSCSDPFSLAHRRSRPLSVRCSSGNAPFFLIFFSRNYQFM